MSINSPATLDRMKIFTPVYYRYNNPDKGIFSVNEFRIGTYALEEGKPLKVDLRGIVDFTKTLTFPRLGAFLYRFKAFFMSWVNPFRRLF